MRSINLTQSLGMLLGERTTRGMNWDGEGLVLLTAVTITEVSPSFRQRNDGTGYEKIKIKIKMTHDSEHLGLPSLALQNTLFLFMEKSSSLHFQQQ